jgi:amphi-Trp domain-containing protein
MDLIEHGTRQRLRREEAATRLRELADELARQNEITFSRDGRRYTVAVPDEVQLKVEAEIEDDKSEIELEITW